MNITAIFLNALPLCGTVLGLISATPQILRLLRTREIAGISCTACSIGTMNAALWMLYALLLRQPGMIVQNGLGLTTSSIVLGLLLRGKRSAT